MSSLKDEIDFKEATIFPNLTKCVIEDDSTLPAIYPPSHMPKLQDLTQKYYDAFEVLNVERIFDSMSRFHQTLRHLDINFNVCRGPLIKVSPTIGKTVFLQLPQLETLKCIFRKLT